MSGELVAQLEDYLNTVDNWVVDRADGRPISSVDDAARLQKELWDAGIACPTWPAQHGGWGLGRDADRALDAAIAPAPAMRLLNVGLRMVAPTLIDHADDAMLERYLPPMARGHEVWCELFSEPSAGSDLAGLTTRAEETTDGWRISGQKVWTTGAHYSHFGLVLARTDFDRPKRRGITAFVLDMSKPGIEVRPLRQITGATDFNEVFLDGVEVSELDVVGRVHEGWAVAKTMLGHERAAIGASGGRHRDLLTSEEVLDWGRATGSFADAAWRSRAVDALISERVAELLANRVRRPGSVDGRPSASLLPLTKLASARLHRRLAAVAAEAFGPAATGWPPGAVPRWAMATISAPRLSIAGGTNEILRSKIAEDILGLPREPDHDRLRPYAEVLRHTRSSGGGSDNG